MRTDAALVHSEEVSARLLRVRRFFVRTLMSMALLAALCQCAPGVSASAAEPAPTSEQASSVSSSRASAKDDKLFDQSFNGAHLPWYSSKNHGVRFLPAFPAESKAKPVDIDKFEFEPEPLSIEPDGWLQTFFGGILPAALLALLIAALIFIGWRVYLKYADNRRFRTSEFLQRQRRIETLAEEARARFDDLDKAAEEALAAGDLRSAIVFFFSWILVEMDKHGVVLLDKGKTNLEYWRELAGYAALRDFYRVVMLAFERVYFGGREISRPDFDAVWNQRERFAEMLREEDERRERLAREEEEARRRAEEQKWQTPKTMALIGALLMLTSFSAGCRNYWREEYASPARNEARSLNGVAIYEQYLAKRFPKRFLKLRSAADNLRSELERCDTIVWFYTAPDYSDYFWSVSEVGESKILYNLNEDDDSETAAESLSEKEEWIRCLERYALASVDDWPNFCLPSSNLLFHPASSYFSPQGVIQSERVRRWLQAKPGRTCVVVLADQSSELEYWRATDDDIVRSYKEPERGKMFEERERRMNDTRTRYDRRVYDRQLYPQAFVAYVRLNMLERSFYARRLLLINEAFDGQLTAKIAPRLLSSFGVVNVQKLSEYNIKYDEAKLAELNDELDKINSLEQEEKKKLIEECEENGLKLSEFHTNSRLVDFFESGSNVGDFRYETTEERMNADAESDDVWAYQSFVDTVNNNIPANEPYSGDESWTSVLPKSAPMREQTRLAPVGSTETLLAHGGVPVVCRRQVAGGTVLLVNSTSFLSNYSLIDETNRKLASRLADEFTPTGKIGVLNSREFRYVENVDSAPRVTVHYAHHHPMGRFSLTAFSPFTLMVWNAAVLAIVVFFCSWPIFGRPRRMLRDETSDFSSHINATAQLLKRTDSVAWVREQIELCRRYLRAGRAWGRRGDGGDDLSRAGEAKPETSAKEETSAAPEENAEPDASGK